MVRFSNLFFSRLTYYGVVLQPHHCVATTMVWALPRSLATTWGIIRLFSLPRGTKMFQFPRFASCYRMITALQAVGLSHSEILGLKVICTYPRLIAAYHVLHRLREPRHPPCALFYFLRNLVPRDLVGSSYFQLLLCFLTYSFACINMSKIVFSQTLYYIRWRLVRNSDLNRVCMPVLRRSLFPYFVRQCAKKRG